MVSETTGQAVSSFCVGCGKGLIVTAAICPACGTPVRSKSISSGKDKTVAILLAVFLSGWTWLYTYRVNAAKFWIYIALSFFVSLMAIGAFLATIDSFDPGPAIALTVLFYLVGFGFWIWAIIDSAVKPKEFYEDYGR